MKIELFLILIREYLDCHDEAAISTRDIRFFLLTNEPPAKGSVEIRSSVTHENKVASDAKNDSP